MSSKQSKQIGKRTPKPLKKLWFKVKLHHLFFKISKKFSKIFFFWRNKRNLREKKKKNRICRRKKKQNCQKTKIKVKRRKKRRTRSVITKKWKINLGFITKKKKESIALFFNFFYKKSKDWTKINKTNTRQGHPKFRMYHYFNGLTWITSWLMPYLKLNASKTENVAQTNRLNYATKS